MLIFEISETKSVKKKLDIVAYKVGHTFKVGQISRHLVQSRTLLCKVGHFYAKSDTLCKVGHFYAKSDIFRITILVETWPTIFANGVLIAFCGYLFLRIPYFQRKHVDLIDNTLSIKNLLDKIIRRT